MPDPMTDHKQIDPTILIIFGATGELARERLLPSLFHLHEHSFLPKVFSIVGFARSEFTSQDFRKKVKPQNAGKTWDKFAKKIHYVPGNFTELKDFKKLANFLHNLEGRGHSLPRRQAGCANRLFYFSTLPSHYETISESLHKSGLLIGCKIHKRQTRVVVEKPFGHDLKSAQKLDRSLNRYFEEDQIYRIDHYLGKETVQNLLTVRFANSIFEPIWDKNFIDHVQITALEPMGVGNRGAFYEQAGAIRDFVQNHVMQLVAITAMEQPADLSTESIRNERAKVMRNIRIPSAKKIKNFLAVGQYSGYNREAHVSPKSRVETYAAMKLFVDNERWAGIPFYVRTGKKLGVPSKTTEVSIHFRQPIRNLFDAKDPLPNILTFTVQPMEGIYLHIMAKYPGFGVRLHPVTMELGYHSAFRGEIPEAYERLLLDFMEGDQRLFTRSDEIESSWKYVDELEKFLDKNRVKPELYDASSMGPQSADKLITKDKRQWHLTQVLE